MNKSDIKLKCAVWLALAAAFALFSLTCGAQTPAGSSAGRWILVAPPAFRTTLAPLIEQRRQEGFDVVVVETTSVLSPEELRQGDGSPLRARLSELIHQYKGPTCVLLAGAFDAATNTGCVVPSLRGAVGRMKDEPSDLGFGLPGPDGAPTVAVGRFPARTAEELRAMVQKTLRFEPAAEPAPWRNRVVLLLGNPGGGPMAESYVERTLDADLAALDPSWEVRTLFNVTSSRFYLPRPKDRQAALQYLADGDFFSVYLGHSNAEGLGLDARFMLRKNWEKIEIPSGAGPFFTCGCFACQSNGKDEGYGLAAMRNPSGPVAVIGASGESYSAPGQLAAEGFMNCFKHAPFPSRLADYWLAIQSGLACGKMDAMAFMLLDMADGTGGKVPLATQRIEHLEMWMLLGDPALRMPVVPSDVSLGVDGAFAAGKALAVRGVLPKHLDGAKVHLTLERLIGSVPAGLEKVPANSPENREARNRAFDFNFERANSFILAAADAQVSGSQFTGSLAAPSELPWSNLVLRATATLPHDVGFGILTLTNSAMRPGSP
jgi:hypothetical protein